MFYPYSNRIRIKTAATLRPLARACKFYPYSNRIRIILILLYRPDNKYLAIIFVDWIILFIFAVFYQYRMLYAQPVRHTLPRNVPLQCLEHCEGEGGYGWGRMWSLRLCLEQRGSAKSENKRSLCIRLARSLTYWYKNISEKTDFSKCLILRALWFQASNEVMKKLRKSHFSAQSLAIFAKNDYLCTRWNGRKSSEIFASAG